MQNSSENNHTTDSSKPHVIRIPVEPHFAGGYRLEYDGKYITLFGLDKRYAGMKLSEEQEDWYEEMVLIPVVAEIRDASPSIIYADDKRIIVETGCA